MTEQELQQYLIKHYPKEDEACEWKEFKNLKNDFNGHEKDDIISYVSALANMEGGHLVVGVVDKTLEIVGTDTYNYDAQKARLRLISQCTNLPSEGLLVEEFITSDTNRTVWVIHVPKHLKRQPVYAHNKAWQRLDDSLIELTDSRKNAILEERDDAAFDWTAEVIADATIDDLEPDAIVKAREGYKQRYPKLAKECDGTFFEGDYTQYITGEKTPKSYRNPALVKAMVNIKMIDTQGYGIHKMFVSQKERFLPMPDYDLSTADEVVLNMPGTIIDENYSLMLLANQDLSLTDAVLLDQVQKGKDISPEAVAMLRKRKLIEGRLPHIYVAKDIAQVTGQKVEYSKHKGLADKKCKALLMEALEDHHTLSREEIDKLWWNLLPDTLSDKQKKAKVGNMLTKMREEGDIVNTTVGNSSIWSLLKSKN